MRLNEIEGVGKEAKNVMWWNEKRKSRPPTRVVVVVSHLPQSSWKRLIRCVLASL